MKKNQLCLLLLLLCPLLLLDRAVAAQGAQEGRSQTRLYRAGIEYEGIFEKSSLYRLQNESRNWFGNKRPASLGQVGCSAARKSLERKGHWIGRIAADGSCGGEGDPVEWVTGNYLNFEGQND